MSRRAEAWFEKTGLEVTQTALNRVAQYPVAERHLDLEEDDISLLVQHEIERELRARGAAYFCLYQRPTYDAHDIAAGLKAKKSPKLDLALQRPHAHGDICLSIEAKILVVKSLKSWKCATQARAYVKDGIKRFVDGYYARSMRLGVMLGYVRTGTPQEVVPRINKAIKKRALACTQPLKLRCPSRRLSDTHYRSVHPRNGGAFSLHHFLAVV